VALDVSIIYDSARELTPVTNTATWSSAAVGGFAAATFDLPGWVELAYLAKVQVQVGDVIVWEGRVEDCSWRIAGKERFTSVSCLGYRAALQETSTKRIWSLREIDWQDFERSAASVAAAANVDVNLGAFNPEDPSTGGVQIQGLLQPLPGSETRRLVYYRAPSGVTLVRIMGTYTEFGTNAGSIAGYLGSSADGGAAVTDHTTSMGSGTNFNQALVANANMVIIGSVFNASLTPDQTDRQEFTNVRILGTSLTEDATGGFLGATLMRDVLALVPEITIGVIENSDTFSIEELARERRGSVLSLVEEIAGYFTHEWGVWEGPRFDWTPADFDNPDLLIDLNEVIELELTGTVEGVKKTYYVSFTDAATDRPSEQSAVATSQRNPYAKSGRTSDFVYDAPFPMTNNTAAQLANRLATDLGAYVPANGTIVLPATAVLKGLTQGDTLVAHLRPGVNVLIPDLPIEDIAGGRDGRSLLRVSSIEADLNTGHVTLEVDSAPHTVEVLFARLAAVTRTVQTNFK
jgi:hypothetical protein